MTMLEASPIDRVAPAAASPTSMSDGARRAIAGVVLAACMAVLVVAAVLEPSPTGMGTHERLGLPPCGWIVLGDLPCPTCGMTTAFAHAANGELLQSFLAQPLGCVLAILTAMIAVSSIHVVITGSRLGGTLTGLFTRKVAWALGFAVLASWMFKIGRHKGWL